MNESDMSFVAIASKFHGKRLELLEIENYLTSDGNDDYWSRSYDQSELQIDHWALQLDQTSDSLYHLWLTVMTNLPSMRHSFAKWFCKILSQRDILIPSCWVFTRITWRSWWVKILWEIPVYPCMLVRWDDVWLHTSYAIIYFPGLGCSLCKG